MLRSSKGNVSTGFGLDRINRAVYNCLRTYILKFDQLYIYLHLKIPKKKGEEEQKVLLRK